MATAKTGPSVYQLNITLLDIIRPIWRRIQVPSNIPLSRLHDVFQTAMGWTNSHMHQFEKGRMCWSVPQRDGLDDDIIDERRVELDTVLIAEGDSMSYLYDFGDDWRHKVVLEKILPSDAASLKPVCLAGERRCPPEDVGGAPGYQEFLEVIFQPGHEEFARLRGWSGGTFHAEEFDLEAVNKALRRMRWPVKRGR
ncbi:MAG TPA: plasmid pRiA4b ORF-3 family protein [Bryobacteraceae bacterium]|nr:plasmid pRiA4b ORF-3 family protein [Bryobacteraceae bacterium]